MNDEVRPRIGVFVCGCGGEISNVLDTQSLRDAAAELPGVAYSASEPFPCSKDGQARMQQAIGEQGLERVLVAGCTPRLVKRLFEDTIEAAGLERSYLDVRNIREHCAYVHAGEPEAALQKAIDLIAMGVERLSAVSLMQAHEGRVHRTVMVIGSDLGGLTVATTLAARDIEVALVEEAGELGSELSSLQDRGRELIADRVAEVEKSSCISVRLNARVVEVVGQPGKYQVSLDQDGQAEELTVGAIVLACGAEIKGLSGETWHDRQRVKTLSEYRAAMDAAAASENGFKPQDVVIVLNSGDALEARSLRLNSAAGVQQALRTKQQFPQANVTVLFRELPLANEDLDAFTAAKDQGVTFYRCQEEHPPAIGDQTVDVHDAMTGDTLQITYDMVVIATPLIPQANADSLAAMLRLPQDEHGFIVEARVRLRPGNFVDDGVYVLGSAHHPSDTSEALFHAYVTSARVQRFLAQETVRIETPVAEVDAALCTGCGNCVQACPRLAIELEKHEGVLSRAHVNTLRCIGCGNCVVVCPVKAIVLPGWDDAAIMSQISAASRSAAQSARSPRVLALACEWSAYAAADMTGVRRIAYPSGVRIIPMNCSARFDPDLVLWALLSGSDGVYLGACHAGECHYGTGNLYASERVEALKKHMAEYGLDPRRLRLEFLAGDDSERFAETITDFVTEMKRLDG